MNVSSIVSDMLQSEASRRQQRQRERAAKREQRHAQYRKDSAIKDRKAMRKQGIKTFNTNDEGW